MTMGMPAQMLANLTPQQKQAMLAMTQSPEIQARAQERVAHEEEWKQEEQGDGSTSSLSTYQWKNTRDDVFVRYNLADSSSPPSVVLEPNRLEIAVGGKVLVNRQLFQSIHAKESTWKVQDGVLVICLRKAQAPMRWLTVYR